MAVAIGGRDEDRTLEAEQELAFADTDRLPWLESDDDDDDQPRVETGRIVAFAAVGLLALVLLLGALIWFTRDGTDSALVVDGSTIEAPDGPYKVRPTDPGGRQVTGTGDTSFEVAEGKSVEGRIADAGEQRAVTAPSTPSSSEATPSPASGIGVQVGAYSSKAAAEAGWSQLSARLEPLQGRNHRVVEGTADSGTVFRLQAVAGSAAEADALCRSIKAAGGDCQVKR